VSETQAQNPFQPPRARLEATNEPDDQPLQAASRGSRFGAYLIDILPFVVIGILAAVLLPALRGHRAGWTGSSALLALVGATSLGWMIYNASLVYLYGQTFGKKVMGIRVVRMDGSRVAFGRFAFLRALPIGILAAIPYLGWLIRLTDVLLIFRDSRRCIHDQIADTQVVTAHSSPRATLAGSRALPAIRF